MKFCEWQCFLLVILWRCDLANVCAPDHDKEHVYGARWPVDRPMGNLSGISEEFEYARNC